MSGNITFKDELTIDELLNNTRSLLGELMRCNEMIVDITEVKKIDIAAIQMLIAAKKECEANGKSLIIMTSDKASDILSFMGLQL